MDDGLKPIKTIGIASDKVALGIIYPSTINMSPERKMSIKNLKVENFLFVLEQPYSKEIKAKNSFNARKGDEGVRKERYMRIGYTESALTADLQSHSNECYGFDNMAHRNHTFFLIIPLSL